MRKRFLGSLAALAAGAGLTFGQPYGPPPGPGGPPPGSVAPPPGAIPGPGPVPNAGPSAPGMYGYTSPDGHPIIMPPGMDGMIPPGTMGMGSPGGAYGGDGGYGQGRGILGDFFGGVGGAGGLYAGVDYLYWVPKSQNVSYPLVTTSAPADLGVLGQATTVGLCGPNDDISYDYTNGYRIWVGKGVGGDGAMAIELGGFCIQTARRTFSFQSNGVGLPVLAVPFFDVQSGSQASYIVSFPGINTGGINVVAETRAFGGEANLVYKLYGGEDGLPGGLALIGGVRYFQLQESLAISTRSQTFGIPPVGGVLGASFFPGGGGLFAGTDFSALAPFLVTTTDHIRTTNEFYGGQLGFRGEAGFGKWFVEATGKAAAGWMRQRVDLEGVSTMSAGGIVSVQPGGLFNAPQDLCRHRKDEFACLLEGGVNVGCQLSSWCRVHAGYTFLYTNNVLRPTSVTTSALNSATMPVSPTFNGSLPSTYAPRDTVRDTDFFLHGLNVGLQIGF